jgi:adenosine deaminase
VRLAEAFDRADGRALLDTVRGRDAHLEVCPTSNVHTGAVGSLASHPIARLWRAGISLSFHTDNRLMSMVKPSDEAANLVQGCGLTLADLVAMGVQAARHSLGRRSRSTRPVASRTSSTTYTESSTNCRPLVPDPSST